MNAKVIITVCLLLAIGLLKSDQSYGSYEFAMNATNAPDDDYYDPEVYYADAYDADSDYQVPPDDAKHYEMDIMYGAFKIITKPKGADINLYDSDLYLSTSPSPVYPVIMDESMELREGIPGRTITLMITKEGYKPMKKDIFVPFLYQSQERALNNPTVFKFDLKRDYDRSNVSICFYYSYANRHHRHRQHHHWFGAPSHFPWCPPGFIGWYYPPRPPHYQGPHYGCGYWTPNPPPPPHHGDGHHGGGQNPPNGPWDGGTGSHGDYPPHHNMPFPPPVGNGQTNPSSGNIGSTKPVVTPENHSSSQVIHAKPDFGTKPDGGVGSSNVARSSAQIQQTVTVKPNSPSKPLPQSIGSSSTVQKPQTSKPNSGNPQGSYQEKPKPQEKPQPSYNVKPQPKPERDTPKPTIKETPKPKPAKDENLSKPKPQQEHKPTRPAQKEKENLSKPKPKPQTDDEETKPKEDNNNKTLKFVKA